MSPARDAKPPADPPRYWFPAKRYGWGWGFPSTWQGWLVLAAFVALVAAGAMVLLPRRAHGLFIAYAFALVLVFVAICWAKGEPPRWRWGGK